MSDAGALCCAILIMAWIEWRDYRKSKAWYAIEKHREEEATKRSLALVAAQRDSLTLIRDMHSQETKDKPA